ncbi:MAG: AAA family ATPase [Bacteroidetes bacterium]|nr:AAA family ATPase [Bacteroidota bacterium]
MAVTPDAPSSQNLPNHGLNVSVKNFGPIYRGNIDIRPLTVFVGQSNTGKSYLATLVYSLHRYFSNSINNFTYFFPWKIKSLKVKDEIISHPDIIKYLDSWISALNEEDQTPPLPERVEKVIRSIIENAEYLADPIEREIIRCYGINSIGELIRLPYANEAEVIVDIPQPDKRGNLQYHLGINHNEFNVTTKLDGLSLPFPDWIESRDLIMMSKTILNDLNPESKSDLHNASSLLGMLAEITRNTLNSLLSRNAYYLPADRTGVMHSHQVVVSAIIQNATTAGLRPANGVPILSGVLSDFLEQLIQMASKPKSEINQKLDSLASSVEETVLKGGVNLCASSVNFPHFYYKPNGWNLTLPLMRSSSMVSELTPIVLYLRHILIPGDILIIEEPESHLHPEMQIEVIRLLARVVRSGVQVVVTTHSEWVLDEIATIVQRSQKRESDKINSENASDCLFPHEVGAWLFKHHGKSDGVVVEELEIDNSGLYPSGFDRVAIDQHNRWAEVVSETE